MILVIAEKPSVAQSIAKVLGATSRKDGYLEGCGSPVATSECKHSEAPTEPTGETNYIVSWCVGHLVGLADASSYDERYAKWRYDDLPIVPEEWLFEVPKDKAQQFKVLRDLMKDKRVTELVCATDAGREGELIFRLVYNKAGCTKPFKRLWISSLEDAAIREGFNHLRDSSDYDKLYEAALSRSKADWIVGINGTRLFSTLYKKRLVVGRVQTPTLAMLVEREGKITAFRKEKYFNVHIEKDGLTADMEKVKNEDEAKAIAAACDKKQAVVSSLKRETKTVNPPKLYDLTTLQREANRYYSFTAQQTLELVQSLYEKKLLTYPRTDSQFITDDMEGTARQVIGIICRKVPIFDGLKHEPDIKRITNNAKVTDHHAIIPTVQLEKQDISELPESEQKIIRLVAMRLLSSTGEKHIYDETSVTLSCEGYGWGGMLPMREEAAAEVMKSCTVYRLYGDDSEGMVMDASELKDHATQGGIFGVEKVEWKASIERQNHLKAAEMSTEDDYGMIDGIINNGPKEKEDKSSDKGSKSSIMDRLKAAKSEPHQDKLTSHKERKNDRDL